MLSFPEFLKPQNLWRKAGEAVGELRGVVEQGLNVGQDVAYEAKDRLELGLMGGPQGPFPSMRDLQKKFPKAGLPDTLMGTTIDNTLMQPDSPTPDQLMAKVKAMGMNTVRLGAYWDEIQPNGPHEANFKQLDALLAAAQKHGLRVVMSVGAKSPNWPEYHVPKWATPQGGREASRDKAFEAHTLRFVEQVAAHVAGHPAIAMWQVENEPFDPSGPDQLYLSQDMVAKEAAILRRADAGSRPVLINCWSAGDRRDEIDRAFAVADLVGLDVYERNPGGLGAYERTVGVPAYALKQAAKTGKPAMIAELQADDWADYTSTGADVKDLTNHLTRMGYRDFLFWRLKQNLENERHGNDELTRAEAELTRDALKS